MNLFTHNVNEYNEFRDHCAVSHNSLYCVPTNQAGNTVMNTGECKCLPSSANDNKITFEQNANRRAKQKGRLARNNLSFGQVNFMPQFKNLTAANHFFHSTEKNEMTNATN